MFGILDLFLFFWASSLPLNVASCPEQSLPFMRDRKLPLQVGGGGGGGGDGVSPFSQRMCGEFIMSFVVPERAWVRCGGPGEDSVPS